MLVKFIFLISMITVYADEMYTTKFDNIDVDEIIRSDRLLKNYFNCLMDRGPCAPEAIELKKFLPDAMETDCSKCSPKQKEYGKKLVKHLYHNKPQMWKELQEKYDPENSYYNKHKDDVFV